MTRCWITQNRWDRFIFLKIRVSFWRGPFAGRTVNLIEEKSRVLLHFSIRSTSSRIGITVIVLRSKREHSSSIFVVRRSYTNTHDNKNWSETEYLWWICISLNTSTAVFSRNDNYNGSEIHKFIILSSDVDVDLRIQYSARRYIKKLQTTLPGP